MKLGLEKTSHDMFHSYQRHPPTTIPGHLSQVLPHSQQRHTQHVCPTHTHKARGSPSVSSSTSLQSSPPGAQAEAATAPQAAPASGTVNTLLCGQSEGPLGQCKGEAFVIKAGSQQIPPPTPLQTSKSSYQNAF